MTDSRKSRDYEALQACLERLKIVIAQDDDGLTVFSSVEPLFCFTRKTHAELAEVTVQTIRSYLETFYDVKNVDVQAVEEPLEHPAIPRKRFSPISSLRPVLSVA